MDSRTQLPRLFHAPRILAAAVTTLAILLAAAGAARADGAAGSSYLVTFAAGTSEADQAAALADAGVSDVSEVAALRLHTVSVPADAAQAAVDALNANPVVTSVDSNQTRDVTAMSNDPGYPAQWSLPRIGWDQLFGVVNPAGTSTVAILDTGVDAMHEDLAGKVVTGTSILDPFADGTSDPNGHGTEMAGIVAASADNGIGIAGVGYAGVDVMPVQVLNAQGTGQDSDIIQGIVWAADHGADVIQMSFSNPGFSQGLQDAIDYAWGRGAVLVAAAGNDGSTTPHYPAGDHAVVGVGNTDQSDSLDPSSNYGQDVFMAAPGTGIYTTALGNSYGTMSGTSASAAEVAGAAGLIKATSPSASNGTIVGRLARNADAVPADSATGNGRLNVARAVGDTASEPVVPTGAAPVGNGGPFVGPYVAAGSSTISGTVTDFVTGLPISGATVTCATTGVNPCNNAVTTSTAGNGTYSLPVNFQGNSGTVTITASATGHVSQGANVAVTNTTNPTQNFALHPLAVTIDSLVGSGGTDTTSPFAIATNAGATINWHANDNGSFTVRRGATTCSNGTQVASGTYSTSPNSVAAAIAAADLPEGANTLRICLTAPGGTVSSETVTVTKDTVNPAVSSITRTGATPTNAGSVSWTVTFSESVTGVDASDFALTTTGLTGAAVTGVSGSGAVYTVSASTGSGDGTLRLDLTDDDTIADPATNRLGGSGTGTGDFTSGEAYTIDRTPPTVTVNQPAGQADPTNAAPIHFTAQFSEHVNGLTSADVTLGGSAGHSAATVTLSALGANAYDIAVAGLASDGTLTAAIAAAKVSDDAGNDNSASTSTDNSVTYDATKPSSDITFPVNNTAYNATDYTSGCTTPSTGDICGTAGDNLTGVDKVKVSIRQDSTGLYWDGSGFNDVFENYIDATGATTWHYNIGTPPEGSYTIHSKAIDTAGNEEDVPDVTHINMIGFTIDTTPPAAPHVTGTTPAGPANNNDPSVNGTAEAGSTVSIYTDSSCGTAAGGTATGAADGTGHFSIPVHVVDNTTTTFYAKATDSANNPSGCSSDFATYVEDSAKPDVTINQAAAQADPTNTQPIHFTAVFNEAVSGFTGSDVAISGSAGGTPTVAITDSGDHKTYDVAVSGLTSDGTVIADIPAGGATDSAGNSNNASTSGDHTVTLETVKPDVTINQAASQADPTNTQPIHFTAVFNEAVSGFTDSDVTVGGTALGTPSATVTDSGDHKTYDISISGLTTSGTVTASVGANKANDTAGNGNNASTSTDNTVTFSAIAYHFTGFFAPIDGTDTPNWNQAQGGQAIPIKFSLGGYQGMDIFDNGGTTNTTADDYPKSQQIPCVTDTVTPVETTIDNPGAATLTYSAVTDTYQLVWKTDRAWNNTCRQLVVKFNDGQIHRANFKFKK